MKTIYIVIGIILVGVAGSLLIKVIFFPINTAQRMTEVAYDAQDKVLNADNAIYNYEWFKQKYQDIEATEKQSKNAYDVLNKFEKMLPESRVDWSFEDKNEYSRLQSVCLGLDNNLEQKIADYNARANMATRSIFADGVLPSYIDALSFIKK